jgi:hypothetical protein
MDECQAIFSSSLALHPRPLRANIMAETTDSDFESYLNGIPHDHGMPQNLDHRTI